MNTVDRVREIAAKHSGRTMNQISEATRIFHDLAIDGDTAEEFLIEVFREFHLPTEEFPFPRYFGSEVGAGWRHLLIAKFHIGAGALAPLTIGELASWAQAGSWREHHAA